MEWLRGEERTNYPLTLSVDDLGEGFTLTAQVQSAVGRGERVCEFMQTGAGSRWWKRWRQAPGTCGGQTARCCRSGSASRCWTEWNATEAEYPRDKCIHELFEEQVEQTPEAVAVVYEEEPLSYGELNARANQLAHYLRELGVGPDERVGICVERSLEMVVGLLGMLKAGGAYVPLDPGYPAERLQFMLEDAHASVLVTQESLVSQLPVYKGTVVHLDMDWSEISLCGDETPVSGASAENLLYVIYTSGSTGEPKGTEIPHRSIPGFIFGVDYARFDVDTVLLQHSSVSWDALTLELWPALLKGGRCVLSQQRVLTADGLKQHVRKGVNTLWLTATLFSSIVESDATCLEGVRDLMIGGETVPVLQVKRVLEALPETSVVNGYGPSECTVFSNCYVVPKRLPEDIAALPIGRPIGDRHVYVLDTWMNPVPIGVMGEVYIGGPSVGRGYLNRPELTAQRFVPNPFASSEGERLYRTGDRARWRDDGNLEFLGRVDHQVKLRGFRIELGEIEEVLRKQERVQDAVVVVKGEGEERRLVGYVVAEEGGNLDSRELMRRLKEVLPSYSVPAMIAILDCLPVLPNSKVDRKALLEKGLPAPEFGGMQEEYREPRTPEEEILCSLFREVLGVERVGLDDNFFELGGHSLSATRLVSRIRGTLGVEIAIRMLFESPSVAKLSGRIRDGGKVRPGLEREARGDRLVLSHAQQRLWFIDRLERTSTEYNMPGALRLRGEPDVEALERAINTIVERHESLRTHFAEVEGEPVQVIEAERRIAIPVEDLSGWEEGARQERVKAAMREEREKAFDLSCGPVLRVRLLKLGEQEHILLRTMHHIVSDGWSMGVFNREFMVLYEAYREGRENPLKPLSVQYADFAIWQRRWLEEGGLESGLGYWKEQLAEIPEEMGLPLDRPRRAMQTFAGEACWLVLPAEQVAGLKRLSQENQATSYMTLLAGFAVLLSRYSGQEDIVVGSPIANRQEARLEELIGFFVNTLVMRTRVKAGMSLRELLGEVRRTALEAYRHQDVPFERLVEELSPQRSLNRTPVFQVMFALQNAPMESQRLKGLEVGAIGNEELRVRFDLELHAVERGEEIGLYWLYNKDLFDRWRMEQMARHYVRVLEAMVRRTDEAIGRVDVLTAVERREILEEKNRTECTLPEVTVVGLFEEQVERTPEAVAVVCEEDQLSYGELNRRANLLAHYLRELGVRPDERVAICVERGLELVVALLAVQKAGGAYMPLDPAYPVERLRWMLKDAKPVALLTQSHFEDLFSAQGETLPVLYVNKGEACWQDQPDINPDAESIGVTPEHLAYVIYTSGSTGQPKGVMIEHRGLANLIQWHGRAFGIGSGSRCSTVAGVGFDAAGWEIWPVLCVGGRLLIPAAETGMNPEALLEWWRRQELDVSFLPTPMAEYAFSRAITSRGIGTLLVGGDRLRQLPEKESGFSVVNNYGPTEATVVATSGRAEGSARTIHIGRPIANTQIYILDAYRQPVPVGVAGEMYIGGAGVARGYLNRPELTAERFVDDPFSAKVGARMYKTGDMGRWLPDGNIEFLGRNDSQVKIRGFRIELGEIEEVLRQQDRVQDAVVVMKEEEKRLVGYVVAEEGGNLDSRELIRRLKEILPSYSVPAMIGVLDRLPVLPNGKLDRKALLEVEPLIVRDVPFAPPEDQMQRAIAAIWQDILQLEKVSIFDNFFDLGGHSFLIIRMQREVQKLTTRPLLLTDLFRYPTIFSLARYLVAEEQQGPDKQNENELEKLKQGNAERKQRFEKRISSR